MASSVAPLLLRGLVISTVGWVALGELRVLHAAFLAAIGWGIGRTMLLGAPAQARGVRTWGLAMVCLAAGAVLGLGLLWAAYLVSGREDEWRGLRDLLANALAPIGLIVAARLAWLETR